MCYQLQLPELDCLTLNIDQDFPQCLLDHFDTLAKYNTVLKNL